MFGYVTWLLAKAARLAPAAMVTLALSIITILSLAAYAATQAEVIAAVVGTGIGALAGAVTAQLGNKQQGDIPPSPRENPPQQDTERRPTVTASGRTTNLQIPFPEQADPVDVAGDVKLLAEKLDKLIANIEASLR